MKIARIVAREQIIGIENDYGLEALNGIYRSPFHEFKENSSYMQIFENLEHIYKVEINKLFNPYLTLENGDECNWIKQDVIKGDK